MRNVAILVKNVEVHRHFSFAIENVKISNFSLHCPAKMPYLQKYLTNFQRLLFCWKMRKVAIVVNFAQNSKPLTTFPTSRTCKNFNFSHYTVPAEMPYLQKYLTNFQKLLFGWKMRNVAIVVENLKCTDILVLQ